MKWEGREQSKNVEIDCLGERTQMGGPETEAAFKCQAEVRDLKQRVTQESSMQGLISGAATDDKSIAAQNAKTMADFDTKLSMFVLVNTLGGPVDGTDKANSDKSAGGNAKPNRFEDVFKRFESTFKPPEQQK